MGPFANGKYLSSQTGGLACHKEDEMDLDSSDTGYALRIGSLAQANLKLPRYLANFANRRSGAIIMVWQRPNTRSMTPWPEYSERHVTRGGDLMW